MLQAVADVMTASVVAPTQAAGPACVVPGGPAELSEVERARLARRGRQLEAFTVAWAALEAGVALAGAYHDHSVSLAGFGWDSCIEMLSGAAVYWRMTHEMNHDRKHRAEQVSLRIAGWCLYALAIYVLIDSVYSLMRGGETSPGWTGIAITAAALISMPLLTRAKRTVARGLNSRAMMADANQTNFCAIQAAIVLFGLLVRSVFHVGWADAVAGLVLVPLLWRAAREALRGRSCCSH